MRYEIHELLALRSSAAIDIGRFTVYAIENNLFNHGKYAVNANRGRASSSCGLSQRPTTSSEESFQQPVRQPRNAPRSNLAEADSGFAKFLKEHTSPRHQRVTAGGRVVLVDGEAPIPEFRPPLKKHKEDNPKKVDADVPASFRSQGVNGSEKVTSGTKMSPTGNGFPGQPFPVMGQNNAGPGESGAYLGNGTQEILETAAQASYPLLQQWQVPIPTHDAYRQQQVPLLPSIYSQPLLQFAQTGQDTVAVPINASLYQGLQANTASWYPGIAPPLLTQGHAVQPTSSQVAPFLTTTVPPAGSHNAYSISPAMPGTTSLPSYTAESSTQRSLQDVNKEFQALSSQLSNLDRYMAINTFVLDTETKDSLVEQRKSLVKELDMTRRYKEHLESTIKPAAGVPDALTGLRLQQPIDMANGTGFQWNLWSPYVGALDNPGDWPPLVLSAAQNPIPSTFTVPVPQLGYLASFPSVNSWNEYQNPIQLHQAEQQGSTGPQFTGLIDKSVTLPQSSSGSKQSTCTDRVSTDTKASWSSSEIGELHRQIESAARRGEPVDELFKRLAKMTERHAVNRGKQNTAAEIDHQASASAASSKQSQGQPSSSLGKAENPSGNSNPSAQAAGKETATKISRAQAGEFANSKHGFTGPRHSRDSRLRSFVSRTRGRKEGEVLDRATVMFAPWGSQGDENLIGVKGCAPVISRVNAHGLLPSSDGTNDEGNYPAFLVDIHDERDFFQQRDGAMTRPWYRKAPRESPNRVEVHQFFLRVAEEERRMIYKYRMRYPGERGESMAE